jgi:hypothetical protein
VKTLFLATAAFAALVLVAPIGNAHAADRSGQWMDVRHHLALGNLPESSEAIARLVYAKADCRAKVGGVAGPIPSAGFACLKAEGFVWLPDSPAQIAAQEKARQDQQNRETGYAIGQAMLGVAADLNRPQPQPQRCNGNLYNGGNFNMTCN